MLATINNWYNGLPNMAQQYFLNFISLNLSFLGIVSAENNSIEKLPDFLKEYLNGVNLPISEELKRFLFAYSIIDIIIQAKRVENFNYGKVIAKEIEDMRLKSGNKEISGPLDKIVESYASGAEEQMWFGIILSWEALKVSEGLSWKSITNYIL